MPSPRLDDATIEYSFSAEEAVSAQVLDPLKIAWIQTMYAQTWKQKNSIPLPEEMVLDRSFMLRIAELEGRMNAYQALLDGHRTAIGAYQEARSKDSPVENTGNDIVAIAHQAGSLVHNS